MKRVLKYVGYLAGGLITIAVLAAGGIWIGGGAMIDETYDTIATRPLAQGLSGNVDSGTYLATLAGCNGCHGSTIQGRVFMEFPDGTRLVAANLPRMAARYSRDEFARVLRQGIRPDGTAVLGMPGESFAALTDQDVADIYAYLKSIPDDGGDLPPSRFSLGARYALLVGDFTPAPLVIQNEVRDKTTLAENRGGYIARAACTECHGLDLQGKEGFTPSLDLAAAYDQDSFLKFMRTGVAMGDRDVGLMSYMARNRFSGMREDDLVALHDYLVQHAERAAETTAGR